MTLLIDKLPSKPIKFSKSNIWKESTVGDLTFLCQVTSEKANQSDPHR